VQYYRIYVLAENGEIINAHEAHCATDDEAWKLAAEVTDNHPLLEIWQGTRMVAPI
jgi:hypothetical protein